MTRTTNARLAGFTLLFYIAVGVTQMIMSQGMTDAEGTAARLAGVASVIGGLSAAYLVVTALTTVRPPTARARRFPGGAEGSPVAARG